MHHLVEGLLGADGHVVLEVEAQQHALGRRFDLDLATLDIGHFLLGSLGGAHRQRSDDGRQHGFGERNGFCHGLN